MTPFATRPPEFRGSRRFERCAQSGAQAAARPMSSGRRTAHETNLRRLPKALQQRGFRFPRSDARGPVVAALAAQGFLGAVTVTVTGVCWVTVTGTVTVCATVMVSVVRTVCVTGTVVRTVCVTGTVSVSVR
jgi:Flp pilus assembly protein TadB